MLSIAISIALGLVTLLTAYLGVHVTLHPAESARARRVYKAGFIACGIAALALTAWQAQRNNQSQAELQSLLHTIDENTKNGPRPATVPMRLDFGTIVDGGCSERTFDVPGAPLRSVTVEWIPPLPHGLSATSSLSNGNTIRVSLCNLSGLPVMYKHAEIRADIIR